MQTTLKIIYEVCDLVLKETGELKQPTAFAGIDYLLGSQTFAEKDVIDRDFTSNTITIRG